MRSMNNSGKITNKIELVSLHIPKTAGTSFRNILQEVYGSKHVARLDIRRNIELNGSVLKGTRLKKNVRVIHGHFSYDSLIEKFDIQESTPTITWLREPAERVISNYFYLESILKDKMPGDRKSFNLLGRILKTPLEYASAEENRNRISKFLSGIKPEEFFFIGLTDHYEEDLKQLAELLNWDKYSVPKHNITGTKQTIDEETRARIKELNRIDYEIYNEVVRMREKRIKSLS